MPAAKHNQYIIFMEHKNIQNIYNQFPVKIALTATFSFLFLVSYYLFIQVLEQIAAIFVGSW